jgi:hypothetical protein
VQLVVGGHRGVDVAGAGRRLEALVGRAHLVEVFAPEQPDGAAGGELVHRPHHGRGVTDLARRHLSDARVALRLGLDQPLAGQPGQRVPHRRAGKPQLVGELSTAHRRPRRQVTPHHGVTNRLVRRLA